MFLTYSLVVIVYLFRLLYSVYKDYLFTNLHC